MDLSDTVKIAMIRGNRRKLKDLKVVARVESVKNEPTRERRHAIAIISDDTGKMRLSLWNDQIDQVSKGDVVLVPDGFVKKDQGRIALQTWTSKIPKISKAEAASMGL